MKNKGFTLVELLAVIVILAVISIITIPMIGNVIDESKKKALEQSVSGLVEAANYFTISNDGVYEFVFDENKKGETIKGEQLDYKGSIEGTGKLYIDKNGDISLCLVDDKYYVYKNYNSGIYVGEVKDNNCIIGYDVLTNKYVAMLDNGTGQISNVYSKEEVNNLIGSVSTNVTNNTNEITSIKENISTLTATVDNNTNIIATNTNEISNIKGTIETLQNNLNSYALQSELEKTNTNLNNLSSLISSSENSINDLKTITSSLQSKLAGNFYAINYPITVNAAYITNDIIVQALKQVPSHTCVFVIYFQCPLNQNAAIIGYNLGREYGVGLYFNYYVGNHVYKFVNSNYTLTLTGL